MGVALSAAIFQSVLNDELHQRIPNDEEVSHSHGDIASLYPNGRCSPPSFP